ncbi:hypothetical protein [Pseudomonas petrae]|uniref:hypothetical protein n=1 Tax=Pseudomonas petrae TaxID=2912190 RepID=UPI001EF09CF8|nr:hypothetical protein [Pseudomonas petrae]MCF7532284.1 hypothetical protein [Pseudomonas petrae]MCF7535916.1 hypothetical protein [Pseudomonas petrae]MCF7554980.1 hypothetical protein [Pseudomonas petrae]
MARTVFCDHREYAYGGFVASALDKLSEVDARDFIDAVDSGLVTHQAGAFEAACSNAKKYLFWEGATSVSPRRLTLWLEPVITIAGLRRLHHRYGWPHASYAFDFVGYQADQKTELAVCEAKPTQRAVQSSPVQAILRFILGGAGLRSWLTVKRRVTATIRKRAVITRCNKLYLYW